MKVVLLNDTSDNRHFGCEFVGAAYRELLDARGIEILGVQHRKQVLDRELCGKADLVIVNGEGSIHHGGYQHLMDIGKEWPSVLINCSIEEYRGEMDFSNFLIATVRESKSAEYTGQELVPDLIFSHNFERTNESGLFISDGSRRNYKGIAPRAPLFVELLLGSAQAALGRFHAIAIAAIAGIPFSAWAANTWKNEGIMTDMSISQHYYELPEDAIVNTPITSEDSVDEYVDVARLKIHDLFDRIAAL